MRERKRRTIVIVVAYHHLLWLAVFTHLAPKVLVESIEVVLELRRVHICFGIVGGVLVEIGEEDGLAVGGLDVFAGAAVAVSAGADFVVETAVHFVLFGAEDGGEVAEERRGMLVWGGDEGVVGRLTWPLWCTCAGLRLGGGVVLLR